MAKKIGMGSLTLILTAAVLLGAYLGFIRYRAEQQNRTVEIILDLNDLKKIAAFEKQPLSGVLNEVKKIGIADIGVFEETLPDAGALGEIYYAKGSGFLLGRKKNMQPDRTYIYAPDRSVRQRICDQLEWALGRKALRFFGKEIIEADEAEEELRNLGLGISERQEQYLVKAGFRIVPRSWNDPRYHLGNMEAKIAGLQGHNLIIFDGEEILGYPDTLVPLAHALQKYNLRYGYIEIVKQDGDAKLKKLMGKDAVRVHSVPKDELEKLTKSEALDRFVRAARERSVRFIYLRPFLPPQVDAYPVAFNLNYFRELKAKLESAGFTLGQAQPVIELKVAAWQLWLLGAGVLIGALLLLNAFVNLPVGLMGSMFILGAAGIGLVELTGQMIWLQKGLAFLAAVVFPSLAVVSTFSRPVKSPLPAVINVLAETGIGIFLMVGILADARFMTGVETFPAVKLALILPVITVALYFLLQMGEGGLKDRLMQYLQTKVSLLAVCAGLAALGALGILVARSGNFVLPVPAFEKYFRNWLEIVLFVRPRTKEFLIGYPFLFLAARHKNWRWALAAVGVVAPVSVINSFSHIHTPLLISLIRTFNGLVLGVLFGLLVSYIVSRFVKEEA